MPWEGEDRRRRITDDTGRRRRLSDFDQLASQLLETRSDLRETHERLEDAENRIQVFEGLIGSVAEIKGQVDVLLDVCRGIDGKADKATSFKNAVQFAAIVIVPVLVALIGAYALLRSQAPQALPK